MTAVAVSALLAVSLLTAGVQPTGAATVTPCGNTVTAFQLQAKNGFASGGKIKRYRATVDFPGRTGFYDQTGTAILGTYPAGSLPTLINPPIGDRSTIGALVKSQYPAALAAIDGDFFITQNIRGHDVEFSRGPMIRAGKILRSNKQLTKVVGVDSTGKPFAGTVGARGSVSIGTGAKTSLAGVNWQTVQAGGFTLYTAAWSRSSGSPRPAGAGEWVLNGHNKIVQVRTSHINSTSRGALVQPKTKVVAFPSTLESVAAAGVVGQKVRLRVSQHTDNGATLTTAIGRGQVLVKKGVAAPLGCAAYDHSAAARPRTVIGWTRSGEWRSITVPGTNLSGTSRTGGIGLANIAAVAKKMGLRFAYELDGGASTTWYTRSTGGVWTRRDLVGVSGGTYERPVDNGLAFLAP
ncbi:MAG TPA: phosphodiester glycosidase family protein [Actinomycetes bacterium]|nr:phosphodiester glycosidase family protein [Actinomycetes bacterium]